MYSSNDTFLVSLSIISHRVRYEYFWHLLFYSKKDIFIFDYILELNFYLQNILRAICVINSHLGIDLTLV